MRIVFLGSHTHNKKILLLTKAQVMSQGHSVRIFSSIRYDYEEGNGNVCDFCGVEIHYFSTENHLARILDSNPCDYAFIDTDLALNAGHDVKLVSVLEADRSLFEQTMEQTDALLGLYPYTDIHLIYNGVLEYSRISASFLEKLYFRRVRDAVNVTKSYPLYYEEQNAGVFLESLYEERLFLKKFSGVWKLQVVSILGDLTGIEPKRIKEYLKKAERVKRVCR